jgi:hypothetical protein
VDRGGYCYPHECFNGVVDAPTGELEVDCAGRCKPCQRRAGKTASEPPQQSMVVCTTPAFVDAHLPPVRFHMDGAGEGMDLAVTVEASGAWMPPSAQHRNDPSMQISCLSPEARGFQIGGLGAVWGLRILGQQRSMAAIADVAYALRSASGGWGRRGRVGTRESSYAVGSVSGQLRLGSSFAANSSVWQGSTPTAAAERGFILKMDGAGGVMWVCELSGGGGAAVNISLESVAAALPEPEHVPPASTTPPPGVCVCVCGSQ